MTDVNTRGARCQGNPGGRACPRYDGEVRPNGRRTALWFLVAAGRRRLAFCSRCMRRVARGKGARDAA